MQTSILESHQICNIYGISPSSPLFNQVQTKYKNYHIQLWFLFPDKKFDSLSSDCITHGFYPYCIGKIQTQLYIIFRRPKLEYNIVDKFLQYYDSRNLNRNILILEKNILLEFKKYLHQPNEISSFLKYNPIFINSNVSWKYVDKIPEQSNFKIGNQDSSDLIYDKITFHTHPIPTYKLKNVSVAWPSVDDYLGVNHIQQQKKMNVYHIVLTREGLYIIICKGSISEKDIKNKMNIPYNLKNVELFLNRINKVSKNIQTEFYDWSNLPLVFLM